MAKRQHDPEAMRVRIGANIRRLRLRKEWTQEMLAEAVGVGISRVSDIERAIGNPTIAMLVKYAKALNVPVDELLT